MHHLKVFGCVAYTRQATQKLQKLDDKAVKGIFITYSLNSKTYRIFIPDIPKLIISRDVNFTKDES